MNSLVTPKAQAYIDTLEVDTLAQHFITKNEQTLANEEGHAAVAQNDDSGKLRYETGEVIGKGGMGQVLQVFDRELNRIIAMKTLLQKSHSRKEVELFIAEAQVNSQLDHPNMVPVHDIGLDADGQIYFTMRLLRDTQSLSTLIDKLKSGDPEIHRLYTFERRVQLIQQVCNALEYAHQRGVIHCDIKPDNILVGECGQLFVVDWGIATLAASDDEVHSHGSIRTTVEHAQQEGKVYGTLRYIAPERITSPNDTCAQTDIFSVCAVLYELLSLHHYLGAKADTPVKDLFLRIQNASRTLAYTHSDPINGRVPLTLARLCSSGLYVKPQDRIQSIGMLNQKLQEWVEGRSPMVCPTTTVQRILAGYIRKIDRYPVVTMLVTLAVLLGSVALIVMATLTLMNGG